MSDPAVVLFNRDLRVHDNPTLVAGARGGRPVVALFVLDERILRSDFSRPNRVGFLLESLRSLDGSLRKLGARLTVRRGDPVGEAMTVAQEAGATTIVTSSDASAYARARRRRIAPACERARVELILTSGVTVHGGDVLTGGGEAFRVFTPYHCRWIQSPRRPVHERPRRLNGVASVAPGRLPALEDVVRGARSPDLAMGGEEEARRRMSAWLRGGLARYGDEGHDDLPGDCTSRLSPDLHFGCLSPVELAERALSVGGAGADAFVRQLAWRDFYHQLLAANPQTRRGDLHPRGDHWGHDERGLATWREGRTGYPIVDAGMRQLAREGWMHNRTRLITASFLTKTMYVDWRLGAQHYFDLLLDGDVANNIGNWQWVAGVGADTRPNRIFNPIRQAERFDPDGDYVRRYVPELGGVEGGAVHEPWRLPADVRRRLDYPDRIVDHDEGARRFRAARARAKEDSSGQLRLDD